MLAAAAVDSEEDKTTTTTTTVLEDKATTTTTTTTTTVSEDKTTTSRPQMTWSMAEPAMQTVHQLARLARAVQSRKFPVVKRDIARILTAYSQSCASLPSDSASMACAALIEGDSASFAGRDSQSMPAPPVLVVTALDSILRESSFKNEGKREELLDACGAVLLEGFAAAAAAAGPVAAGEGRVSDARRIGAAILGDALGKSGQVQVLVLVLAMISRRRSRCSLERLVVVEWSRL